MLFRWALMILGKYLKNRGLDSIGSTELFNGWKEIRRRFREDLPPLFY